MGNVNFKSDCLETRNSGTFYRGNTDTSTSAQKLKSLLVDDYGSVKSAFLSLPSESEKAKFLDLFSVSEHEFLMGSWRVQMAIDILDEAEATEKLATLQSLAQ